MQWFVQLSTLKIMCSKNFSELKAITKGKRRCNGSETTRKTGNRLTQDYHPGKSTQGMGINSWNKKIAEPVLYWLKSSLTKGTVALNKIVLNSLFYYVRNHLISIIEL